ncbi:MAG: phosphoenolpyruvate--protein phosphotransferase [Betaproteobacteria bacterium]|nr:phosphoenolpyruvate--protein phosphotransferase [Betaproteobacteria bacterium]
MSFTMHGIPVSGGIAIGHAHLVSHAKLEVAHYVVPQQQIAEESARFAAALETVRADLEELRSQIPPSAPREFESFLNLHLMILDDATLSKAPRQIIETEHCNAEWALKVQMDALLGQFDQIEDAYLNERKADVIQVVERLLKALLGHPGYVPPPAMGGGERLILVARDLSPADVIQFRQHQLASFITDLGGATSHTAIVARSLNIPSIVALHHARQLIRENELLIVDGTQGMVVVDPDPQALAEYKLRQHQWELERQKLKRLRDTRATTLDQVEIELQANIELPDDVEQVREYGATGIGLFRTEFLFLNRDGLPDEDEQFEAYRRVVREMDGLPVTVRTYDLGADKHINGNEPTGANPALGLRAIRLSLTEPQMFLAQLCAMLRASHYGKLKILIPMLMSVSELNQTLNYIAQARQNLEDRHIAYDRGVEIGGMIEIPAAALALNTFVSKLDFLSIGTNDLIQYTLALDRTDDTVSHLYDPLHPAVLNLISHIIRSANKAGKPIALCGEMAGDVQLTRLLLGFGLRQFSMHPSRLLEVKQQVLQSSLREAAPQASKMLRTDDPDKLRAMLARLNA